MSERQAPFQHADWRQIGQMQLHGEFLKPREINPIIPRELEAICLKAMAFQRERRYSAANELAEELQRWQSGQSVAVRLGPAQGLRALG